MKRPTARKTPFGGHRKVSVSHQKRIDKGLVCFAGEMKAELYAKVHHIMQWEGIKQAKAISFLLELGIEVYDVMLKRLEGNLPAESPTFAPDSKHTIEPVRGEVVEEAADSMLLKLQQLADGEATEDVDG